MSEVRRQAAVMPRPNWGWQDDAACRGKEVVLFFGPDGEPLQYGKRAFLNRGFVATGGWKPVPIGSFLEPFSGGGEIPEGV